MKTTLGPIGGLGTPQTPFFRLYFLAPLCSLGPPGVPFSAGGSREGGEWRLGMHCSCSPPPRCSAPALAQHTGGSLLICVSPCMRAKRGPRSPPTTPRAFFIGQEMVRCFPNTEQRTFQIRSGFFPHPGCGAIPQSLPFGHPALFDRHGIVWRGAARCAPLSVNPRSWQTTAQQQKTCFVCDSQCIWLVQRGAPAPGTGGAFLRARFCCRR
jgi:hypothetical protein